MIVNNSTWNSCYESCCENEVPYIEIHLVQNLSFDLPVMMLVTRPSGFKANCVQTACSDALFHWVWNTARLFVCSSKLDVDDSMTKLLVGRRGSKMHGCWSQPFWKFIICGLSWDEILVILYRCGFSCSHTSDELLLLTDSECSCSLDCWYALQGSHDPNMLQLA
jgi:hypothetical protein